MSSGLSESALATAEKEAVDDAIMDDETDKMKRAARQIEFYFADSNLPFDRFMWTLHTSNAEHWVPISTVASFKRMREFTPLGVEWVAKAIKWVSEELEVDETNTKVRRTTEVKEPKGQFERSIYAKGFGEEYPGIQQDLEAFFNKYGKVNAVRMRRIDGKKEFKGSVFVEFTDFKTVEAFLKADPKPSWKGQELLIMSKTDYCELKITEKGLKGQSANTRRESMQSPTSRPRGFNAFQEMAKAKKLSEKKTEVWLEFMGYKLKVRENEGVASVNAEDVQHVKGSTLKFVGSGSNLSFKDIKEPLSGKFSRAPYIKYEKGADHGLVGFDKELSEEDVNYVKEKLATLDGNEITWSPADATEEKEFQIERANVAARGAVNRARESGSTNRGGRGGRGGGRGGRGGRGGGGRDKEKSKPSANEDSAEKGGGEKRKRGVEPDGAPDTGIRGQGVPTIQASKKVKTDGEES